MGGRGPWPGPQGGGVHPEGVQRHRPAHRRLPACARPPAVAVDWGGLGHGKESANLFENKRPSAPHQWHSEKGSQETGGAAGLLLSGKTRLCLCLCLKGSMGTARRGYMSVGGTVSPGWIGNVLGAGSEPTADNVMPCICCCCICLFRDPRGPTGEDLLEVAVVHVAAPLRRREGCREAVVARGGGGGVAAAPALPRPACVLGLVLNGRRGQGVWGGGTTVRFGERSSTAATSTAATTPGGSLAADPTPCVGLETRLDLRAPSFLPNTHVSIEGILPRQQRNHPGTVTSLCSKIRTGVDTPPSSALQAHLPAPRRASPQSPRRSLSGGCTPPPTPPPPAACGGRAATADRRGEEGLWARALKAAGETSPPPAQCPGTSSG